MEKKRKELEAESGSRWARSGTLPLLDDGSIRPHYRQRLLDRATRSITTLNVVVDAHIDDSRIRD
jgi:hypothetical protein